MPLFNFNMKAREPDLLQIDFSRVRSTESTEDARAVGKDQQQPPAPAVSPQSTQGGNPWRTKELSSVYREPRKLSSSQDQEDMWTLKRCDAFDEDDDC